MKTFTLLMRLLFVVLAPQTAIGRDGDFADRKFALVFGLGNYTVDRLENTRNDAEDMASALAKIGFNVTTSIDPDLAAMRLALAEFESKLPERSVSLVYFAGHGVQYEGNSYLLPIGSISQVRSAPDLRRYALSLSELLSELSSRERSVNVVIVDACRNSPFKSISEIRAGLSRGTSIKAARGSSGKRKRNARAPIEGSLIAYSTSPDTVAEDGEGRNSPYTKHLKRLILQPETSLEAVLKATRLAVTRETRGRQTPWYESSISGEFFPAGRGRIEFRKLIELLVPEKVHEKEDDRFYDSHDWSIGAWEGSPIKWLHDGARETTKKADFLDFSFKNWGSPYLRTGEVVITFDGKPTHHVVKKRQQPGKWRIVLAGPRAGVTAVGINNDALSHELGELPRLPYLKEVEACRTRKGFSGGTSVYKVDLPGRSRAWLGEQFGCGSGGCTSELVLVYNRRDTKRLGCPE